MFQSIGVINIIKLLVAYRQILPCDSKSAQNFPIIIPVSDRLLQIFLQGFASRPAFGKGFQIRPDPLTDPFPFLLPNLQLLRRLPQRMHIPGKKPPKLLFRLRHQGIFLQVSVYPLGGQWSHILPQYLPLSVRLLVGLQGSSRQPHIQNHIFYGDIRRQIPFFPIQLLILKAMRKNTVKQNMQIHPGNGFRLPPIQPQHIHRVIKAAAAVGSHTSHMGPLPPFQTGQGAVKKAQMHQYMVMGQRHHLFCKLMNLFRIRHNTASFPKFRFLAILS